MNERIKELAHQAGMSECALGYGMPENVLWGDDQIENFAELLIKETLRLARVEYDPSIEDVVYNYFGVRV